MNWVYNDYFYTGHTFEFLKLFLIPLALFDVVLKGFALWKSAKKDQNVWFIALLIVNSMGILPLIYLILNRDQKESPKKSKKAK
jgi:hypothetical protein